LLPKVSGTVDSRGESVSFSDFGIHDDVEMFKSFYAEAYIDRFGIRVNVEDNYKFRGRTGTETVFDPDGLGPSPAYYSAKISELSIGGIRFGVDVDVIRTPYLRAGIDFDYHMDKVQFMDRRSDDPNLWTQFNSGQPMTAGVHARIIPMRLREVPFTVQARARFPISFWQQKQNKIDIIDWEVSGGLRQAVWETSLLGHSTFSVGIEAGFRAMYINMNASGVAPVGTPLGAELPETHIKARWWGPFVQAALFY